MSSSFLIGRVDPLGATHDLDRDENRGERISQLVRQQRQELVFPNTGLTQQRLGAGAFDGLPGPVRGLFDEFNFL